MSGAVLSGALAAKLRDLAGVGDEADAAAILAGLEARRSELTAAEASDKARALVAAAVADGRIPRARTTFWLHQLAANPTAAATLAALGAATSPAPSSPADETDDNIYAALFPEEADRG